MRQLWAPWRMAYVSAAPSGRQRAASSARPPAAGPRQIPGGRSRRLVFTLLNRFPYTSGHLMTVPVRHAPGMLDMTPDEGAAIFAATRRAMIVLSEAMHPDGFNIGINQGSAAGASAEHVHQHVVPRWSGDTNFMPVLGDVKVLPEDLETTASNLREAFVRLGPL